MEHNHNPGQPPTSPRNLLFAIVINGGIVAVELAFGLVIGSMALISDGVHNLSDIAHLLFSYWAERVARARNSAAARGRSPVFRSLADRLDPTRGTAINLDGHVSGNQQVAWHAYTTVHTARR